MKSEHIKRMITLTGDNIKRLSLYKVFHLAKEMEFAIFFSAKVWGQFSSGEIDERLLHSRHSSRLAQNQPGKFTEPGFVTFFIIHSFESIPRSCKEEIEGAKDF